MAKQASIIHMGMTKSFVRDLIKRDGAKSVLNNWTGTDEEALKELDEDSRDVFCSCDCIKNDDGSCSGVVE